MHECMRVLACTLPAGTLETLTTLLVRCGLNAPIFVQTFDVAFSESLDVRTDELGALASLYVYTCDRNKNIVMCMVS